MGIIIISDHKFAHKPLGSTTFFNKDGYIGIVRILFLWFFLLVVIFFGWHWSFGIKDDPQVIGSIFLAYLNLQPMISDCPSLIFEEIGILTQISDIRFFMGDLCIDSTFKIREDLNIICKSKVRLLSKGETESVEIFGEPESGFDCCFEHNYFNKLIYC